MAMDLTAAQAQWVVERLLAERRITSSEVRTMLAGLSTEIADIERRLASLRKAGGTGSVAARTPRSEPPARTTRKRRGGRRTKASGHPRGIAGTLAVLLRAIPAAEHAAIATIRADKGIKAAISAAKKASRQPAKKK